MRDQFANLTGTWILSCNDENPTITYEGIRERLGIERVEEVKLLVLSRRELFRPSVPEARLEKWKVEMREGRHLPSWIKKIKDARLRKQTIDELSSDDVFRNQFRPERQAPPVPIEIVEWGLKHIERLLSVQEEQKKEKARHIANIWLPFGVLIVSLVAVISSVWATRTNVIYQQGNVRYETEFSHMHENYVNLLSSLVKANDAAWLSDHEQLTRLLDEAEGAFYGIAPFLVEEDHDFAWQRFQHFVALCYDIESPMPRSEAVEAGYLDRFLEAKTWFRVNLYDLLFD